MSKKNKIENETFVTENEKQEFPKDEDENFVIENEKQEIPKDERQKKLDKLKEANPKKNKKMINIAYNGRRKFSLNLGKGKIIVFQQRGTSEVPADYITSKEFQKVRKNFRILGEVK